MKCDDWNTRKLCVDISYAMLVIDEEINKNYHEDVLELKYDKIKHVRDSVNNYINLYRQIYNVGKEKDGYGNAVDSYRYTIDESRTFKQNNENSVGKNKKEP